MIYFGWAEPVPVPTGFPPRLFGYPAVNVAASDNWTDVSYGMPRGETSVSINLTRWGHGGFSIYLDWTVGIRVHRMISGAGFTLADAIRDVQRQVRARACELYAEAHS